MGCFGSKEGKEPLIAGSSANTDLTKAKAVKDFSARKNTEVSFTIGDLLEIVDKTQKDYWMGQVDGQTAFGWFPSNCVLLIDEKTAIFEMEKKRLAESRKRKEDISIAVHSPAQRKSITVNSDGKVVRARAITNHTPDNNTKFDVQTDGNTNSIGFKNGDFIVVTDKSRADYWLGHIEGSNQWGWFPASLVEIVET